MNFPVSKNPVITAVHGTSVLFAAEAPAEDREGERLWQREFSCYLDWEAHFHANPV